jgi:hypothetical protein
MPIFVFLCSLVLARAISQMTTLKEVQLSTNELATNAICAIAMASVELVQLVNLVLGA